MNYPHLLQTLVDMKKAKEFIKKGAALCKIDEVQMPKMDPGEKKAFTFEKDGASVQCKKFGSTDEDEGNKTDEGNMTDEDGGGGNATGEDGGNATREDGGNATATDAGGPTEPAGAEAAGTEAAGTAAATPEAGTQTLASV